MAAKRTHEEVFSSSSSSPRWEYDVFLSFRGEDTRTNFTDHLYGRLDQVGIRTFRDDEELKKGEDISSKLMDAIEGSRIAIVVFSKNYASSTWCLDELVKILNCKKYGKLEKVLPIFYKVDPSDVRHQKNTFEKAFVKHEGRFKEEMEKVNKWRDALKKAANLSGWHVTDGRGATVRLVMGSNQETDSLQCGVEAASICPTPNPTAATALSTGHEWPLMTEIVGEVLTIVNQTHLHVAAYPVGLDRHVKSICCLLNDSMDVVRIVGIHGLGGIGKTTIANAVFNDMFLKFDGGSFLADVRKVSSQQNGSTCLQTQLLSDILKEKNIGISYVDRGITMIKERLRCKRVLIVLDDVDKKEQLHTLVGKHGWFGPGSRIIITTRDEHLLNVLKVDEKYEVETMNQKESLELFSYHAFEQNHPLEGFVDLSDEVVNYAKGLPLALETLGSLLSDKRSQEEWEYELKKCEKILNDGIFEILEISYHSLDDLTKKIFLDISCFLNGGYKDEAIKFLDGCGLCPVPGIRLLIERSLLKIYNNQLWMHDLIQDMGRKIVYKSSQNPGERSRLWLTEDSIHVLATLTGTSAVECLQVNLSKVREKKLQLTTKAFLKMPNLRLLQIYGNGYFHIDWKHRDHRISFFRNLVWIQWTGFPFKYIPNNFGLGNLVILEMTHSNLKEIWKGIMSLPNLKTLDLGHSCYLTCTPDFSGLPNLEKLILFSCESLVKVHGSIDHLGKLVCLGLMQCSKLRNLPSGVSKLASLEELNISLCSKIEKLPEEIGNLTRLQRLSAEETAIEELPSSLKLLKNLTEFRYNAPLQSQSSSLGARNGNAALLSASLHGFRSLDNLCIRNCNLTNDDIPDDLWKLCSLVQLDLSRNDFVSLPSSICQLSKLEYLTLDYCTSLKSLPVLPSSLKYLWTKCCRSSTMLPDLWNLCSLVRLDLSRNDFVSLPSSICQLSKLEYLILDYCTSLKSLPMLPSSLKYLGAICCRSLTMLPNLSNLERLRALYLAGCSKLNETEIEELWRLEYVLEIDLTDCDNLDKKRIFQEIPKYFGKHGISLIHLSGRSEIPEYYFDIQSDCEPPSPWRRWPYSLSAFCQVTLPHNMVTKGLLVIFIFENPCSHPETNLLVVLHNQSKNSTLHRDGVWFDSHHHDRSNHLSDIAVMKIPYSLWESNAEYGDTINVSVTLRDVSEKTMNYKMGVHLCTRATHRMRREGVQLRKLLPKPKNLRKF